MEANTRHFCEGYKPRKQGNNFWSCNILIKCGSKVIWLFAWLFWWIRMGFDLKCFLCFDLVAMMMVLGFG